MHRSPLPLPHLSLSLSLCLSLSLFATSVVAPPPPPTAVNFHPTPVIAVFNLSASRVYVKAFISQDEYRLMQESRSYTPYLFTTGYPELRYLGSENFTIGNIRSQLIEKLSLELLPPALTSALANEATKKFGKEFTASQVRLMDVQQVECRLVWQGTGVTGRPFDLARHPLIVGFTETDVDWSLEGKTDVGCTLAYAGGERLEAFASLKPSA